MPSNGRHLINLLKWLALLVVLMTMLLIVADFALHFNDGP